MLYYHLLARKVMTKARPRQSILLHDMVTLPAVTDTYVFAIDLVRPGFLGTVPVFFGL